MTGVLRRVLRFIGKSDSKVAAVFAFDPVACHTAVAYLRHGAPGIPIWLFSTVEPRPETESLCDHVEVRTSSLALLFRAECALWPYWVALGVSAWTGEPGRWPVKWAPFLVPPFRALILNEHGDFLPGTPSIIQRHAARRVHDAVQPRWQSFCELIHAYWLLVSYHIWRSARVRRVKDKLAGFGLLLAGGLLRLTGFPNRRWFQRLHGTESLEITVDVPAGDGVLRITRWNPLQCEHLLRTSDARWVLWQERAEDAALLTDAAPLFEGPRTFAVSRQSHFRAWKPMMFATSPFRALQPGEISRVLAPLGSSILFDRRKLMALGMPGSGLAGTAWMILFWKAAAAGWRSYSIGSAVPLREQPDLPTQEAGFLYHLLRDPSLRRLAPLEPELSRGSISTSISGAGDEIPAAGISLSVPKIDRGRLKILLVSPFLPYPLSHGGAVRIYNLCRILADRVDLLLRAARGAARALPAALLGGLASAPRILGRAVPARVGSSSESVLRPAGRPRHRVPVVAYGPEGRHDRGRPLRCRDHRSSHHRLCAQGTRG